MLTTYSGDANYQAAIAFCEPFTVFAAPAITSADNATFTTNIAGSFTVRTTGLPNGASMHLDDGGTTLPAGVTFVDNGDGTATLSGTPAALTSGTYSFLITASNGIGTDATQPFTLTVDRPPVITSSNATAFKAGTAGAFTIVSNGFPGIGAMTLSDGGATLPAGVTFVDNGDETATLSGSPAVGTGGIYTFTITAHNGAAPDATQSFTLTIDESPTITSADNATFILGRASSFTVTMTGFPAGATASFSDGAANLPTGVSFVDTGTGTATLAGTPAERHSRRIPIHDQRDQWIRPGRYPGICADRHCCRNRNGAHVSDQPVGRRRVGDARRRGERGRTKHRIANRNCRIR